MTGIAIWAGVHVAADIARLVDGAADTHGIPRNVLRAIVLAESSGDPGAVGDAGASVGLLQLHERGQGAGMSVAERKDPVRNLAVGVPPIADAWRATGGLGNARSRVERTAGMSGHPGDPERLTGHPKQIAETGIASIVSWWERLEAEAPSTAAANINGLPAGGLNDVIDEAIAFAREHPAELLIAGAVLMLVL